MFNLDWAKRTHKGLRRWILYIVKDAPKTGAEIMDAMEAMSQGWWRPSPGSIYPLLDGMVKEGVLGRSRDEKKYLLTDRGREEIEGPMVWPGRTTAPPRSVEEVLDLMSSYVSYLEDLAASQSQGISANSSRIRELRGRLAKLGGQ